MVFKRSAAGTPGIQASVIDAMFIGDLTEFVLDAYGTRLIARVPERALAQAQERKPGQPSSVERFVAPEQIVVLPAVT